MIGYLPNVPGDSADADAYNLLAATINQDMFMGQMVLDHQVCEHDIINMLSIMTAWTMLLLAKSSDKRELLRTIREMISE
jgi:hypothetical protein